MEQDTAHAASGKALGATAKVDDGVVGLSLAFWFGKKSCTVRD